MRCAPVEAVGNTSAAAVPINPALCRRRMITAVFALYRHWKALDQIVIYEHQAGHTSKVRTVEMPLVPEKGQAFS